MKNIKKRVKKFILAIGSYLIPKKKNYFLFYPILDKEKFSGNIRSLILYINKNRPDIQTGLITERDNARRMAELEGVYTVHSKYRRVLWSLLRAEYIFVDAYTKKFIRGRFSFIQLWHGSGFKNVGSMWEKAPTPANKIKATYQKIYSKCKMVIATSESDAQKQNLSFQTNRSVVTGYPRNDVFFHNQELTEKLKQKYHLQDYKKIIAYAPTHRDSKTLGAQGRAIRQPFSKAFWVDLQRYLKNINGALVIKKHPSDSLFEVPKEYPNILDLTLKADDPQEILLVTDLLISDYSSIVTDFAITGKPILIYAYDLEQYIENVRSLYYDLEEVLPKPFIRNEEELLDKIKNNEWQNDPKVKESYTNFRTMFHKYLDGNSSKRVVEEILKQK